MAVISRGWRYIGPIGKYRGRPTDNGIFREESGIKKLCPFAFRRYAHPDRGSMTPTGSAKRRSEK